MAKSTETTVFLLSGALVAGQLRKGLHLAGRPVLPAGGAHRHCGGAGHLLRGHGAGAGRVGERRHLWGRRPVRRLQGQGFPPEKGPAERAGGAPAGAAGEPAPAAGGGHGPERLPAGAADHFGRAHRQAAAGRPGGSGHDTGERGHRGGGQVRQNQAFFSGGGCYHRDKGLWHFPGQGEAGLPAGPGAKSGGLLC